jgi:hypothetical protein
MVSQNRFILNKMQEHLEVLLFLRPAGVPDHALRGPGIAQTISCCFAFKYILIAQGFLTRAGVPTSR